MTETANHQSNLDHLPMDVDPRLMGVLRREDVKVSFVQLYAVTPNCHTPAAAKHPVSRIVTTCDMHNERHWKTINASADR